MKCLKLQKLEKFFFYKKFGVFFLDSLKGSIKLSIGSHFLNSTTKGLINVFIPNKGELKSLVQNINSYFFGLSKGYFFELSIRGIGFKVYYFGNHQLFLQLGYSHFIVYQLPLDVMVFLRKNKIYVFSVSKQSLGVVVSQLRNFRCADAYKGNGIIDSNKLLSLKEGKKR